MALETLKDVKEIDGFNVVDLQKLIADHTGDNDDVDWEGIDASRDRYPISIDHDKNMISFKIQNGAVKENGVNGCQIDTIIKTAKIILEGLNNKFPSKYNYEAITGLNIAINSLRQRTMDRINRDVEGLEKA